MTVSSQFRQVFLGFLLSLLLPLAASATPTPEAVAVPISVIEEPSLHLNLSPIISPAVAAPYKFNLEDAEFAAAPAYFPALPNKAGANAALPVTEFEQVSGYQWRSAPPDQPDFGGAARDAFYFLGYQFIGVAALYVAPESISGWTDESKEDYSFSKWRENVSNPVWDKDKWYVNYLSHPYWGGAYYIQARERGLDKPQSFLYSVLLSTLWEYGVEAVAEPVSKQDLIITPVIGFFVGEYIFSPLRQYIREQPGEISWSGKVLLALTDPLGVMSAQTDKIFGIKTTVRMTQGSARLPSSTLAANAQASGLSNLSGIPKSTIGIELRMDW